MPSPATAIIENYHLSSITVCGRELPAARKTAGKLAPGRIDVPADEAKAIKVRLGKACEGDAPTVRIFGV